MAISFVAHDRHGGHAAIFANERRHADGFLHRLMHRLRPRRGLSLVPARRRSPPPVDARSGEFMISARAADEFREASAGRQEARMAICLIRRSIAATLSQPMRWFAAPCRSPACRHRAATAVIRRMGAANAAYAGSSVCAFAESRPMRPPGHFGNSARLMTQIAVR